MRENEVRDRYRRFAETYDDTVLENGYVLHEAVARLVFGELEERVDHPRVLDLGCGTGLSARPFLERGWQVVGIDISAEMLDKARSLPFESLIEQSVLEPLEVGTFDACVITGVFELIEDVERVLKNAIAHAKLIGMSVPVSCEAPERINIIVHDPCEAERAIANAELETITNETIIGYVKEGVPVTHRIYLLRSS